MYAGQRRSELVQDALALRRVLVRRNESLASEGIKRAEPGRGFVGRMGRASRCLGSVYHRGHRGDGCGRKVAVIANVAALVCSILHHVADGLAHSGGGQLHAWVPSSEDRTPSAGFVTKPRDNGSVWTFHGALGANHGIS